MLGHYAFVKPRIHTLLSTHIYLTHLPQCDRLQAETPSNHHPLYPVEKPFLPTVIHQHRGQEIIAAVRSLCLRHPQIPVLPPTVRTRRHISPNLKSNRKAKILTSLIFRHGQEAGIRRTTRCHPPLQIYTHLFQHHTLTLRNNSRPSIQDTSIKNVSQVRTYIAMHLHHR